MKALSLVVRKLWPSLFFSKSRSNLKVKVMRSKFLQRVKVFVTRNTHMRYESSIYNGLKVMAKVKVFVHAANADTDADADGKAMTLAPRTFVPARLKENSQSARVHGPPLARNFSLCWANVCCQRWANLGSNMFAQRWPNIGISGRSEWK